MQYTALKYDPAVQTEGYSNYIQSLWKTYFQWRQWLHMLCDYWTHSSQIENKKRKQKGIKSTEQLANSIFPPTAKITCYSFPCIQTVLRYYTTGLSEVFQFALKIQYTTYFCEQRAEKSFDEAIQRNTIRIDQHHRQLTMNLSTRKVNIKICLCSLMQKECKTESHRFSTSTLSFIF